MTKRNRRGSLWLSPLLGDDPSQDSPHLPVDDYSSASFGLTTTCADALQGTYMVRNQTGAQWLIARGADGLLDIITRPQDRVDYEPADERILASVKAFITRNER
jgi:hypothetical protein